MARNIVLIPVERASNRIADIFCIQGDRHNYRWLRSYVRNSYQDCRVITTTEDKLSALKTRVEPWVGTYLTEEPAL